MDKPAIGIRKRQQISHDNRVMLLWIAGASIKGRRIGRLDYFPCSKDHF